MANSGEPVPRCKFTDQEKKDFCRALNTYPDTYDRYAKIISDERLSFLNESANPQFKVRTNVDLKDLKRNMISPRAGVSKSRNFVLPHCKVNEKPLHLAEAQFRLGLVPKRKVYYYNVCIQVNVNLISGFGVSDYLHYSNHLNCFFSYLQY